MEEELQNNRDSSANFNSNEEELITSPLWYLAFVL